MTSYDPEARELLVRFGAGLRAARARAGFSQEELAERAGLHRTYVGAIERGERNVSVLNIYSVARALDVHARDLFD